MNSSVCLVITEQHRPNTTQALLMQTSTSPYTLQIQHSAVNHALPSKTPGVSPVQVCYSLHMGSNYIGSEAFSVR